MIFAVTRMLPSGPVLSEAKRTEQFGNVQPSGVTYSGASDDFAAPRLPFLVFGVTYDVDIVLVSDHPEWDMHEYARIATPDGSRWLAKDSRASNGDQLLVAEIDDIDSWLPEIPLARKSAPLEIEDRSSDALLDISLSYENHDGEAVRVHYVGSPPRSLQSRRNGSTMGHSREQVLAVLDLSHQNFGRKAAISIGGVERGIERVFGLVPMRLALRQTQGGVAEGNFRQHLDGEVVTTTHTMPSGAVVTQKWEWTQGGEWCELRQHAELRDSVYRFARAPDGGAELVEVTVTPWNDEDANFRIEFAPALPDLSRRFDGEFVGQFVMDVGTQGTMPLVASRFAGRELKRCSN